MNISPPKIFPAARRDDIVTREIDGELLIYDCVRDKAHCLNETAAAIWKHCDGKTSPGEIAESLTKEKNGATGEAVIAVGESIVWLGLDELRRKHLLKETSNWPLIASGFQSGNGKSMLSRREAIRRIGLGAAIALPVVATITAPTPAQAGTCRGGGATCGTGSQCCSGVCSGGTCLGGPLNREDRRRR